MSTPQTIDELRLMADAARALRDAPARLAQAEREEAERAAAEGERLARERLMTEVDRHLHTARVAQQAVPAAMVEAVEAFGRAVTAIKAMGEGIDRARDSAKELAYMDFQAALAAEDRKAKASGSPWGVSVQGVAAGFREGHVAKILEAAGLPDLFDGVDQTGPLAPVLSEAILTAIGRAPRRFRFAGEE